MKGMRMKVQIKKISLMSLLVFSSGMYSGWFEHVKNGDENVVQYWLEEKKQYVEERDGNRRTAMHWAAQYGHTGVAKILLKHKADINATNRNKWTPLHTAASFNRVAMIEWLVNHGADMDIENLHHWRPVDIAKADAAECLRLLMQRKKAEGEQKQRRSDAVAAARSRE